MTFASTTRGSILRLCLLLCSAILATLATMPRRAPAATFTVDSTADAVDAVSGDGTCATANGACTLRAALQEANALAGADSIVLRLGTYNLTRTGGNENAAATGDLDITGSLTLTGDGAESTVIDGSTLGDRLFDIRGGTTMVTLSSLT